jgi:hypothetical protein
LLIRAAFEKNILEVIKKIPDCLISSKSPPIFSAKLKNSTEEYLNYYLPPRLRSSYAWQAISPAGSDIEQSIHRKTPELHITAAMPGKYGWRSWPR